MKNLKIFGWNAGAAGGACRKKTYKKICVFAAVMLFVSVLMTGCKVSPTLQEVRYTDDASLVDTDVTQLDPEDWGELEEQFENEQNESSDTERHSDEERGLEDETANDTDSSTDVNYQKDKANDLKSNEKAGGSEAAGNGNGNSEETSPEYVAGDPAASKQVVDASGRTVTLPENVDSAAAVGAAAQMVEMLGGSGKLMGADSALLGSSLAKAAFSDIGSIKQWWSGDGSDGISESSFSQLLAAKPGVCLELSGSAAFSDAQVAHLEQAGIPYVVLPALDSQEGLEHAVTLVGQILGGNAVSKAAEYNSWVESTVNSVGSTTSDAKTGLYLTEWDSAATYTLDKAITVLGNSNQGSGLAVAYSPKASQLVSTFMEAAGVTNESTRVKAKHRDTDHVYVCPGFRIFSVTVNGEDATFYSGSGEYGSLYDLFVSRMTGSASYVRLGDASYPAVIVDNQSVKEGIEGNWFWQYHEIDGTGYIKETIVLSGNTQAYNGMSGPYSIYVNPQGMVNWAEGSVESPLEAYWVASKIQGAYSISEVKSQTSNFYQKFFGCTLSAAQLTAIFGE